MLEQILSRPAINWVIDAFALAMIGLFMAAYWVVMLFAYRRNYLAEKTLHQSTVFRQGINLISSGYQRGITPTGHFASTMPRIVASAR